ncbi:MAG: hypothetical protein GC154_13210 [bacterium]|nr:hypothetical protein [bacterium]
MNQRGRRSNPANTESSGGGNALFTLGLVSVVALLIVGWVMQGGMTNVADKGRELINLNLKTGDTAANTTQGSGGLQAQAAPQQQPNTAANPQTAQSVYQGPMDVAPQTDNPALVKEVEERWQTKLQQEREQYQQKLQELKNSYESQVKDLEMKLKILQIENKSLRGGE